MAIEHLTVPYRRNPDNVSATTKTQHETTTFKFALLSIRM